MARSQTTLSPHAYLGRKTIPADRTANESRLLAKKLPFSLIAVAGCLIALSSIGCSNCNRGYNAGLSWLFTTIVEQPVSCYRERIWAQRAFNLRYPNCDSPFPSDFRAGFIEGYCNASRGGDVQAPPLPPEAYWSSRYTTEQGSKKVESWFAGYPAGAKAALSDGNGRYHDIKMSSELMETMAQLRNAGEDVVSIDSMEPSNSMLQESDITAGSSLPYAGPIHYVPPHPSYMETSPDLPPVIRANQAIPQAIPASSSGMPLGTPGRSLQQ